MITIQVTKKMKDWADREYLRFLERHGSKPFGRDSVAVTKDILTASFLAEVGFFFAFRDAVYNREYDFYDYTLAGRKIDVKETWTKWDPETKELHFHINENLMNKPFDGTYVFAFVNQPMTVIKYAGWLTFDEFKEKAVQLKAGVPHLRGGRSFTTKLDVRDISTRDMHSMESLLGIEPSNNSFAG